MLKEEDLVRIFSSKSNKAEIIDKLVAIMSRVIMFAFAVVASYVLINFYGFKNSLSFWYQNDIKSQEKSTLDEPDVSQIASVVSASKTTTKKTIQPDMPENSIRIPAISVDAPISWRVNNIPKDVSKGLSEGVIHINGTALPGEKGNVYITGHSSNYVWVRQKYNSIFSNTSKLVVGDIVYVKFGADIFVYKVYDQKIVAANDLSILNSSKESRLTLSTCWPLGTSLKRMVVLANQIYPKADKNKASKEIIQFTKLPAGR